MDESAVSEQSSVLDMAKAHGEEAHDALSNLESLAADPALCAHVDEVGALDADALLAEPSRLAAELQRVRRDTEATVFANYKTFIGAADCSTHICSHFADVSRHMDALCGDLQTAADACGTFQSGVAAETAERRAKIRNAADKHQQLLDVLEMPQLMETCVRAGYWEEALSLCAHAGRLQRRMGHIAIVADVAGQVQSLRALLLDNLLAQLDGAHVTLPLVLRVVPFLRRLHAFEEHELRIRFLMARERYLSPILSGVPSEDAFQHCSKYMELARVHLFDIATQYKAAFASDIQDMTQYDMAAKLEHGHKASHLAPVNLQSIFNQWLFAKIEQVLSVVRGDAHKAAALGDAGRLDSLATQSMYFGASFGRLGVDFRSRLVRIFVDAVGADVHARLRRAEERMLRSLPHAGHFNDINASYAHSVQSSAQCILAWPLLAAYTNAVAGAFNAHRNFMPLNLAHKSATWLNGAVQAIALALVHYGRQATSSVSGEQLRTCGELLVGALPPALDAMLENAFPEKAIRLHLGLSATSIVKHKAGDDVFAQCRMDAERIRSILGDILPDWAAAPDDVDDGDDVPTQSDGDGVNEQCHDEIVHDSGKV